jgi:tRNA(Ile)-lysidine synthase TilS/MesJ
MQSDISYSHWKKENESILKNLAHKNVFLLFSGGKDSSLAMDFLLRAGKEFGFDFEVHASAYPVHRYTDAEKKRIESYWQKRGGHVNWHSMEKDDDYIKNDANPCLLCQKLRKKMLKKGLAETVLGWEGLVIIICHTLWDIASYSVEHMLTDIFPDPYGGSDPDKSKRFIQTAQRFYPVLKMEEGYIIFRPMIKYNNTDIQKAIAERGIPTLSIPCKFKSFSPKRIMEEYYEKMGLRFNYSRIFAFAKKSLNLPDISAYTSIKKEEYLLKVF